MKVGEGMGEDSAGILYMKALEAKKQNCGESSPDYERQREIKNLDLLHDIVHDAALREKNSS